MTAPASPWELTNFEATLSLGSLRGTTNALAPYSGLNIALNGVSMRLFRVELPPGKEQGDHTPDCFVRGCDLVATYVQDDRRKVRGQVYWRAITAGDQQWPAIELIVSVQTSLLDSDPTLAVRSTVPATEVLGVKSIERGGTNDITPRASDSRVVTVHGKPPSFWLFRLPAADLTYVEMIHPLDFVHSSFRETAPGEVEHATQLFRGRLEKGVILRSRLCGVFVPRSDDVNSAIACYNNFAASEPPLTA
jgi:hypothetical protein